MGLQGGVPEPSAGGLILVVGKRDPEFSPLRAPRPAPPGPPAPKEIAYGVAQVGESVCSHGGGGGCLRSQTLVLPLSALYNSGR